MDFPSDSLLTWKTAAVLLWFALLFAGERLAPASSPPASGAAPRGAGGRRVGRNLALWLMNVGLSPLVVLPLSL